MTRKALGRGLSALIREVESLPPAPPGAAPAAGLESLPLALIDANPVQPRRQFPEESLQELANSIRATGLLQPVLVRRAGARYQLVAGERRWRAAQIAALEAIPAIVRDLSDQEALEIALTENLLREELNALEVAHAYSALQEQFGLTQEQIAGRLGVNRVTVANTLRLLRLPPEIQDMMAQGELTAGHGRALLGVDVPIIQYRFAGIAKTKGLSVRQVEEMVAAHAKNPAAERRPSATARQDPNVRVAAHELERALGTRVRISGNGKRGKIQISYFSAEDLNRIYEQIAGRQT